MWRIMVMSIILLHLPFFAFQAIGGTALNINNATVDVENEILSLYGINFTSCGPLNVMIGDTCLTCIPNNCYITSGQIECGLTGTPALSGGTWSVRISGGNAPHCNEEIDVFIPTGLAQCNAGDFVECYSGDPATKGVGPCKSGIRTCIDGAWGPCEGEVIPEAEVCDDTFDNDCDGLIDQSDPDCCIDNDKDGYGTGPGCLGPDCNDNDPNIYDGAPCDGPDLDWCKEGVWVCDGPTPVCTDTTGDNIEVCNGDDDDCDGQFDEGPLCDDGLSCTSDVCVNGSCLNDIIFGYCRIDDACYSRYQSKPGDNCLLCDPDRSKLSWSPRFCNDFDPCTDDSCDAGTGCVNEPINCDDGLACTEDFCVGGTCMHDDLCTGGVWYDCGVLVPPCYQPYYCSPSSGTCKAPNCCY